MAEYSGRLSRSRQSSSRQTRHGSAQNQNHPGAIIKGSDTGSFRLSEGTLVVSSLGQNLDRELNNGPLTSDLLPQAGEGLNLFTWCELCGANTEGECLIHGSSLITVSDNQLPSRARLSLPSILSLQQVEEDRGKEGIFAKSEILPRTQFGPLEAPPLQAGATVSQGVLDVKVIKEDGLQETLDLSQESWCNWMMFVRPSDCQQHTNLAAYQHQHKVYYISTKSIGPQTELRVWYFPSYGQQLGKNPLPPTLPAPSLLPETSEETEDVHSQEEAETGAQGMGTRHSAEMSRHGSEVGKHTCPSCNSAFRSRTLLWDHTCRVLDDDDAPPTVDTSSRPARRKGRPRKVAGAGGKRGRPVVQTAPGVSPVTTTTTTILPSVTTLIKTEIKAEVPVPDSTVPDTGELVGVARKRGRPKGSKNKQPADGEVKPPRKPPVVAKRQRPKLDCKYCSRSFYSTEQHRVHEAEHTGVKPYVCSEEGCGKGFGSSFKFRRHSLVHARPQDRKCTFCDRRFNRVDHLKNHLATHNSNRRHWACPRCGKTYLYQGTFEYHMALHDARELPQLMCRICHQNHASRQALLQHVHTHNRYKPDVNRPKSHRCSQCDKTFTTTKDVKRHMVTHTKDRAFLCDMCPQTFARKDHLRRHKRSNHKDEGVGVEEGVVCAPGSFKAEEVVDCRVKGEGAEASGLVKVLREKQLVMDGHVSKLMLMPLQPQPAAPTPQQQQQQQQQQLSLLSQGSSPATVQMALNQHQHTDQHQILLQPGACFTTLGVGGETQTIQVIADGNQHYTPSTTATPLKTIPYRFPSSTSTPQVMASAPLPSFNSNLRQMLSSSCLPQQHQQPQQQHQHHHQTAHQLAPTQSQAVYNQQDNGCVSASTIMSMLSSPSSRADHFLDLPGKGQALYSTQDSAPGPLKPLTPITSQWVLAESSAPDHAPPAVQTTTAADSGDHCYATGVPTTTTIATTHGDLKMNSIMMSEESLRLLQLSTSGGTTPSPMQQTSGSTLQASWDEMVNVPFQDMMSSLTVTQSNIIKMPVTVSLPVTEGAVSVTASVTLST